MSRANNSRKIICSDADLARMVVHIAKAAQADAIICVTESGVFAQHLVSLPDQFRVIAATANPETYHALTKAGLETLRLPLHAVDKYRQIRHVFSVALRSAKVSIGDFIVCSIGCDVYPGEGNLVVLTEVEPSLEDLAITDLLKLSDGIRPKALEAALTIACKIGRAARRGKRIGAIFMLGDSRKVLEGSRQLIPNPFQGHDEAICKLTNPDIHDALVELSKLDGAFIVRGDGFIQTAGVFLASTPVEIDLPVGLGARHAAAAAVTARTAATAIVVSATDGNVRVFSEGRIVLQMDPDIEHSPISTDE
jgi:DNA integrity scanning protein DisA with diadenylate cyclase activity